MYEYNHATSVRYNHATNIESVSCEAVIDIRYGLGTLRASWLGVWWYLCIEQHDRVTWYREPKNTRWVKGSGRTIGWHKESRIDAGAQSQSIYVPWFNWSAAIIRSNIIEARSRDINKWHKAETQNREASSRGYYTPRKRGSISPMLGNAFEKYASRYYQLKVGQGAVRTFLTRIEFFFLFSFMSYVYMQPCYDRPTPFSLNTCPCLAWSPLFTLFNYRFCVSSPQSTSGLWASPLESCLSIYSSVTKLIFPFLIIPSLPLQLFLFCSLPAANLRVLWKFQYWLNCPLICQ